MFKNSLNEKIFEKQGYSLQERTELFEAIMASHMTRGYNMCHFFPLK